MLSTVPNQNTRPGIVLTPSNRFSVYMEMREHHPVCQIEPDAFWAISRYHDVQFALKHPEIFSSAAINLFYDHSRLSPECRNPRLILAQDPPEHGKFRSVVDKAFVNSVIGDVTPLLREQAHLLTATCQQKGKVDFTEEFAYPYIGKSISHIIGTDGMQPLSELRHWIELEASNSAMQTDEQFIKAYEKAVIKQNGYFKELIENRRNAPRDDLVTKLTNDAVDGKQLSDRQLFSILSLLIVSGYATTIQMLNHAIIRLSRQPQLITELKASPQLIPQFIDELLRCSPTIQATLRQTTTPVELSGVLIPEGAIVLVFLGSANRDSQVFKNPEIFELSRPDVKKHLSFGHGIHNCLGAILSKLEIKIALETILATFTEISSPPDDQLAWIDSITFHGVSSLPVTFR